MQGTVKSAKTKETAIVSVVNRTQHPLYKKFVKHTKNYACHVTDVKVAEGDIVIIQECRPISKTKKFKVIKKVEKAEVVVVKEVAKKVTKK